MPPELEAYARLTGWKPLSLNDTVMGLRCLGRHCTRDPAWIRWNARLCYSDILCDRHLVEVLNEAAD